MRAKNGVSLQRWLTSWGLFVALIVVGLSGAIITPANSHGQKSLTASTPVVSAVSSTGATISWTTNQASTTQVFYGTTSSYGQASPLSRAKVTNHQVTLSDLTAGVQYHFDCQSRTLNGNSVTTADATFTTTGTSAPPPPPPPQSNPISFVQVNSTVLQTPENPVPTTFTAAQTAGDLNVVVVAWYDSVTTVQSVTDSAGNAYSLAIGPTVLSGVATQSIYYAKNIAKAAANANTVTVEFSEAAPYPEIRILEYSGADLVSPLDVAIGTTGTGTNSSSGAVLTTTSNDLLVGANYVATRTTAAGPGFTSRGISSPDGDIVEDEDMTTTGDYAATAPLSSSGWYVMQMAAFRASGAAPPVVNITTPANNATVSGTVSVTATATSSIGIASVQLQVDGTNWGSADSSSPYSFSWNSSSVANGNHLLTAVAKDGSGVTASSSSVTVNVSNTAATPPPPAPPTLPSVSITSPANGATVSGTTTISASASSGVAIASVQFEVDGNSVGTDTASPYNFSWNTANYANGSHTLTALATDTSGNSAVSGTVGVTVSNSTSSGGGSGSGSGSGSGGSGSGFPSTLGWYDVAGQQIAPNCPPDPSSTGSCYGVVDAWNSAVVDTNRNRLWVWGGGHNDYSGNEIYYFDLASQTMVRANNPANPTPTCTPAFSNGTPSSRHTYGGTVYIPTADVMFVFGGVPYCPSGGFISDTWALSLSQVGGSGTGGWTQLNPTISGNGGNGPSNQYGNSQMQYDPNTGLVFLNESTYGLWSYNYSTNTYTSLNTALTDIGLHQGTVIDPVHKLFLRFGDGSGQAINIAPGGGYTEKQLNMTGCSSLPGGALAGNNPGLQWDPVLQVVVGWPNFGPGVYLYNPATDSCTTQTYSASAPPDSDMTGSPSTTNGTFKRFGYFPAYGIYVLVNEWNSDVHTLRLTAGGGSGSSTGGSGSGTSGTTTTITNVAVSSITTTSATVTWTTSAAATSQVLYGTTSSLGSSTTKNSTMTTSHSQALSGLTASTLYFVSVQSVDAGGNTITTSGITFGTSAASGGTPTMPTASITAPTNDASVSGMVTASASAKAGSNPIAKVQFVLDGANLGSAVTTSPYSLPWNTTTTSNGNHSLSATATDTAGNTAAAAAVSVTVSNSTSNAEADFQARCASAGVIRCVTFDTTSTISGNAAPGLPLIASGLTTPSIDTTTYASGGGSLHFAVPAGATSPNTSGSFNIDFSDDFSQQIDSLINGDPASLTNACGGSPCKNGVWIQWRQRFDSGMLQQFANSNGWKQVIVGEGDTASFLSYSCSDLETVVENSNQFEIPRMYHSCGQKLDEYDPLEVNTGRTDNSGNGIFSPQNAAGGYLNCTFTVSINIPTIPPCVPYVANQWMTFQLHIQVGTWYPAGLSSSGGPPAPFKHDSTIQLYVAQEGQPSQLVMDFHPGATSAACDATQQDIPSCQTGYDLVNPTAYGQPDANGNSIREKFGKIWLLPYQTNLNCPSCSAANTWYDELIISYQQVADPKL